MVQNSQLFLREISEKKLRELTELAKREDPEPLVKATKKGLFNNIKPKALSLLKIARGSVDAGKIKYFQEAIDILAQQS
jgi:hypothetical protein